MGYVARFTPQGAIEKRFCSHEGIDHDSLDAFGYDWEQIGDPGIAPVYPAKIYLPATTEELVAVLTETNRRGEKLTIRSRGHSSNDLVLTTGSVLSTTRMNRILEIDETAMVARLQSGVVSADADDHLATLGYGLPVIGDHNDITVGGFASVGGIGPASFHHGLFVDNVISLEYVTFDGRLVACSRTENSDHFFDVLLGLGRFGVIATMVCRFIRVEKYRTILQNDRRLCGDVDAFIQATAPLMRDPSAYAMIRAAWNDLGHARLGQISPYRETRQTAWKRFREKLVYHCYATRAKAAGTLPRTMDKIAKALGSVGVLIPPRYATIKNVEFFSDRMISSTVGEPTRWFIMLVPVEHYESLFRQIYGLGCEFRSRLGCFSFVCMYIKVLKSAYLSADPTQYFCEMNLFTSITPRGIRPEELQELVGKIDQLCLAAGAMRYMHTKTGRDPATREKLDPNSRHRSRTA